MTEENINDFVVKITLSPSEVLHEFDVIGHVIEIFTRLPNVLCVQVYYDDSHKQIEVLRPNYRHIISQLREFTWRHNIRLQKEGDQNHHNTEETVS